jgi:hypothetical protein
MAADVAMAADDAATKSNSTFVRRALTSVSAFLLFRRLYFEFATRVACSHFELPLNKSTTCRRFLLCPTKGRVRIAETTNNWKPLKYRRSGKMQPAPRRELSSAVPLAQSVWLLAGWSALWRRGPRQGSDLFPQPQESRSSGFRGKREKL